MSYKAGGILVVFKRLSNQSVKITGNPVPDSDFGDAERRQRRI